MKRKLLLSYYFVGGWTVSVTTLLPLLLNLKITIASIIGHVHNKDGNDDDTRRLVSYPDDDCQERFRQALFQSEHDYETSSSSSSMKNHNNNPFLGMKLVIHRNGEAQACGSTKRYTNLMDALYIMARETTTNKDECPYKYLTEKYHIEALFTSLIHEFITTCTGDDDDGVNEESKGFLGYCDRGKEQTPILLDHDDLVPIIPYHDADADSNNNNNNQTYLPCHFHTREGLRITSLHSLTLLARQQQQRKRQEQERCQPQQQQQQQTGDNYNDYKLYNEPPICAPLQVVEKYDHPYQQQQQGGTSSGEIHLYAVPAGRVFMFAPSHVDETFMLHHVPGAADGDGPPVTLQVISMTPRIFEMKNFFTQEESSHLVKRALEQTSDSHKLKRSSTGTNGYNVFERRTSESGWDTMGNVAMGIKHRCFQTLGFDKYLEGHADGLQILRYNITAAYSPHTDWIYPDDKQLHDYDSSKTGGNRFATILLYMSDVENGGETVFPEAYSTLPNNNNNNSSEHHNGRVSFRKALKEFQKSEQSYILERGSWEEEMVAQCRTKLSIRPKSARAILFYSQHPNGTVDTMSLHGACPVLQGEKWAANIWVWNTPREGFAGAPMNRRM